MSARPFRRHRKRCRGRAYRARGGLANSKDDGAARCGREVICAGETRPDPVVAGAERQRPGCDARTARARDREAMPGVTVERLEDELAPAPGDALGRRSEETRKARLLASNRQCPQV